MDSVTIRDGETVKQAVKRLYSLHMSKIGRKGGSVGGPAKSEAAKYREWKKRNVIIEFDTIERTR